MSKLTDEDIRAIAVLRLQNEDLSRFSLEELCEHYRNTCKAIRDTQPKNDAHVKTFKL